MIKTYLRTGAICFGFFMLNTCNQSESLTAQAIVEKAVEAHGGMDTWNKVKQLSFDKSVTLYNEDGSVELSTEQFQIFQLDSKLFAKLEWEQNGQDMMILYENDQVSKVINDSIIMDDLELQKAKNAVFAAHFVISQPFDLLNEGSNLSLSGEIDYEGRTCYQIHVAYEGDTEISDKWFFIIDAHTFEVVANKVVLTDHTSWVDNLTFDTSTKIKFNGHRKSYRMNEAGEKTYLRAEYFYSNFQLIYK